MPDRDVFDRTVRRGWRPASRRLIGNDGDPDAVRSLIRALGKELRQEGCPGFDTAVEIVAEACCSSASQRARRRATERLDQLRLEQASGTTEVVACAANRLLAGPPLPEVGEGLSLAVGVGLLSELAIHWLCPASLLTSLVEDDRVSFQAVQSRREHTRSLLISAPEMYRLAAMLLADPSGASVKTPQMRRTRMAQADILVTALTD